MRGLWRTFLWHHFGGQNWKLPPLKEAIRMRQNHLESAGYIFQSTYGTQIAVSEKGIYILQWSSMLKIHQKYRFNRNHDAKPPGFGGTQFADRSKSSHVYCWLYISHETALNQHFCWLKPGYPTTSPRNPRWTEPTLGAHRRSAPSKQDQWQGAGRWEWHAEDEDTTGGNFHGISMGFPWEFRTPQL